MMGGLGLLRGERSVILFIMMGQRFLGLLVALQSEFQ